MRTCVSAGFKVPYDISTVGFADIPNAMLGHRGPTTPRIDKKELGALGLELLFRENQSQVIEKFVLVESVVRAGTVIGR
jgi:DNA-binding LacI/PurR family transcriptional regulator